MLVMVLTEKRGSIEYYYDINVWRYTVEILVRRVFW